jgi:hypothetical protein
MDKVILLKKHMKTFYWFKNEKSFDSEGEVIGGVIVKQIKCALLPLSNSDLQRLDRGDVSFTDKKVYTKENLNNGDEFVDSDSQDGYHWTVKGNLDYGYQADINIFVIGGVE